MVNEIRVSTWDDLISTIHSLKFIPVRTKEGNHFRSPYVFRGMDVSNWKLQTSLNRIPRKTNSNLSIIEHSLLRSFRKFAKDGTFNKQSEWYLLAVAQHNGLPTRCLDWTSAPLVAAHFACGDEIYKKNDGVIWCLNAEILRKINEAKNKNLKSLKRIAWVYDTNLLEKNFETLLELDSSINIGELLLLWEPPSLDNRIANQSGLLTMLNTINRNQDDFIQRHITKYPNLAVKIIIEAKMKSHLRDMLDQNNITERVLFPGLPGLCDWLKRYYSKAW